MFGLIIQKLTNATLHHENFFFKQKQRERNQMSSLDKLCQSPNFHNHQTRTQTQCGKWGRGKQINDPRIELYPLSLSSGRIQGHKRAYGTILISRSVVGGHSVILVTHHSKMKKRWLGKIHSNFCF